VADSQVARPAPKADVADLEQVRLSKLAEEIAAQIQAGQGNVKRRASDVGDVEEWRRAARKAGRLLGVPIRTAVAPDGSAVCAVDNS